MSKSLPCHLHNMHIRSHPQDPHKTQAAKITKQIVSRNTAQHHGIQHITSYHLTSPHLTLHTSHLITSHRIASHLITSHHITSHHIASHRIASHRITSHHITSHHTTPHHIIQPGPHPHNNMQQNTMCGMLCQSPNGPFVLSADAQPNNVPGIIPTACVPLLWLAQRGGIRSLPADYPRCCDWTNRRCGKTDGVTSQAVAVLDMPTVVMTPCQTLLHRQHPLCSAGGHASHHHLVQRPAFCQTSRSDREGYAEGVRQQSGKLFANVAPLRRPAERAASPGMPPLLCTRRGDTHTPKLHLPHQCQICLCPQQKS